MVPFPTANSPTKEEAFSSVALRTSKKASDSTGHIPSANSTSAEEEELPKYAYTWVLGGIDEDQPAYKGFLYDILISAHLLRRLGSKADLFVLTQLSHDAVATELPNEDKRLFREMGIQVKELPKPRKSSFAQLVNEKFRPLQFTQYRRIIFLDADTIPLVNLDYLFHLSEGDDPILKPNLILATRGEPCNTGMFMMQPKPGSWEKLQGIIERQHESARSLPYPHFDWQIGWGHSLSKEGDQWEAIHRNGTSWRYHAGHSDQGLWYYFTKFFLQDVSIVIGNRLQNISPGSDGKPRLENSLNVLPKYSPKPIADQYECMSSSDSSHYLCNPVYNSFAHFMGKQVSLEVDLRSGTLASIVQLWLQNVLIVCPISLVFSFFPQISHLIQKPWTKLPCKVCKKGSNLNDAHKLWYDELTEINEKLSLGLDMENFGKKHLPDLQDSPLGYLAKFKDHRENIFLVP